MRPQLKHVHSPDVEHLGTFVPPDPGRFGILVQLMVGPEDYEGEESFDLVICTASWLADRVQESGVLDLRHHLLVASWDWDRTMEWIERSLAGIEASSWSDVAAIVGRIGRWEFEDYNES